MSCLGCGAALTKRHQKVFCSNRCQRAMERKRNIARWLETGVAHTSSGIRQNDMPGARIVMIVTRKLSAVAIDDAPANCTPIVKNSWPIGTSVESGA